MSNKINDINLEDLEVWLHENDFWYKDIKFDTRFYFDREGERVDLPDNLQEVCLLIKD